AADLDYRFAGMKLACACPEPLGLGTGQPALHTLDRGQGGGKRRWTGCGLGGAIDGHQPARLPTTVWFIALRGPVANRLVVAVQGITCDWLVTRMTATDVLALVTVSHDSEPELGALLGSVEQHLPGAEVVVVDNASTDQSIAVGDGRPSVRVVALD